MSQKFTLNLATMEVTCPDNTVKKMGAMGVMIEDGKEIDEYYTEWNDIGIFYYADGYSWFQGQYPTYPGSPELNLTLRIVYNPKLKKVAQESLL